MNEIFKGMDNAAEQINENFKQTEMTSGSNEDGDWTKHPDGTLICRIGKRSLDTLGYSNTANDTIRSVWQFPEQFIEVPQVFVQLESVTSGAFVNRVSTTIVNNSTETSTMLSCMLMSGHTFDTSSRAVVSAFAIGRWK